MAASWYLYDKGTILRSDYPYMDVAGSCRDSEFDKVFYLVDGGYESVDQSKAAFKEAVRA
jgi:hypothetical protein